MPTYRHNPSPVTQATAEARGLRAMTESFDLTDPWEAQTALAICAGLDLSRIPWAMVDLWDGKESLRRFTEVEIWRRPAAEISAELWDRADIAARRSERWQLLKALARQIPQLREIIEAPERLKADAAWRAQSGLPPEAPVPASLPFLPQPGRPAISIPIPRQVKAVIRL